MKMSFEKLVPVFVLHKALTLTTLNSLGINWKASSDSGPDLTDAFISKWAQISIHASYFFVVEKLSRRVVVIPTPEGRLRIK